MPARSLQPARTTLTTNPSQVTRRLRLKQLFDTRRLNTNNLLPPSAQRQGRLLFGLDTRRLALDSFPVIARVSLELALRKEFDYAIPPGLAAQVDVGSRVQVPFGARKVLGCVTALAE